jgi:hypothetical protein
MVHTVRTAGLTRIVKRFPVFTASWRAVHHLTTQPTSGVPHN